MSTVRPFEPADRDDVYAICVRTGASGEDATGLYTSDELLPDIFAGPYLAYQASLSFVVDTGAHVAGYVLAVADSRAYAEWYERVAPPLSGDTPAGSGARRRRAADDRARDRRARGDRTRGRPVPCVYLTVSADNRRARAFYECLGFTAEPHSDAMHPAGHRNLTAIAILPIPRSAAPPRVKDLAPLPDRDTDLRPGRVGMPRRKMRDRGQERMGRVGVLLLRRLL